MNKKPPMFALKYLNTYWSGFGWTANPNSATGYVELEAQDEAEQIKRAENDPGMQIEVIPKPAFVRCCVELNVVSYQLVCPTCDNAITATGRPLNKLHVCPKCEKPFFVEHKVPLHF